MKQEINEYIKEAMLSQNELELKVYRLIKTEFVKFETSGNNKELNESGEINILNKMIKQRQESADMYIKADRRELAETEIAEMDVIKRFIPKEPSEDDIRLYFDEIYNSDKSTNMGQYIKMIKEKYPTANGKIVSDIVKSKMF